MKDVIDCFERDSPGHWTCTKACEIDLAGRRIQVAVGTRFTHGTRFMGVDIAELLDEQYEKNRSG